MQKVEAGLSIKLIELVKATPWLMDALRQVRALGLHQWCIGAGAVRNLVWNVAHGFDPLPLAGSDVDVAYFDASDIRPQRDDALRTRLCNQMPTLQWEVVNQAGVHTWFESYFGHAIAPFTTLEDAIAGWPETATAVGVWLDADDQVHVIAPLGLDDLFQLVVRRNIERVSVATYQQRIAQKQYQERWPLLTVLAAE